MAGRAFTSLRVCRNCTVSKAGCGSNVVRCRLKSGKAPSGFLVMGSKSNSADFFFFVFIFQLIRDQVKVSLL